MVTQNSLSNIVAMQNCILAEGVLNTSYYQLAFLDFGGNTSAHILAFGSQLLNVRQRNIFGSLHAFARIDNTHFDLTAYRQFIVGVL